MGRIVKYIGYALLLMAIIFSCKPSGKKEREKEEARVRRTLEPNPIGWDTLSVDTVGVFVMTGLETKMHLKINLQIPNEYQSKGILVKVNKELLSQVLGENYADTTQQVRSIFNKFVKDYLNNYAGSMKKYGENRYKSRALETLHHSYELNTEVLYNEANLISYQILTTENIGRDSSFAVNVKNLLFDLTDGRRLNEDDIFIEDYNVRSQLNSLLTSQALTDTKQDSIQGAQALGYWGIADIETNNNFYVTRNEVVYTFNPGEYADVQKGVLKIAVDFDSLITVLRKESPISILVNE